MIHAWRVKSSCQKGPFLLCSLPSSNIPMKKSSLPIFFVVAVLWPTIQAFAANNSKDPTWWDKYTYLAKNGALSEGGATASITLGGNVDVSNECGPQSETFITLNTRNPSTLAGGSNEIFRLPMRGYYSSNSGQSWGGVDLPLPTSQGTNSINFGSDPTLTFDTRGNLFTATSSCISATARA